MLKKAIAAFFLIFPLLAWETIESEHFVIYYPEGREGEAIKVVTYLEQYYEKVSDLCSNYREKTIVVIQDLGLESNGYTDPFVPSIHIFTSPPYPHPEFGTMRSWWRQVSVHEFTHAVHLTSMGGIYHILRVLFGRVLLPQLILPQSLVEGMAVYSESTLVPYEGRLNEGFYSAYMKNSKPFDLSFLMGEPLVYPFYSMRYIYGGEFTKFLAEKYGENSLSEFISAYGRSILQFVGITPGAYRKTFGRNFQALYKDFVSQWKVSHKKVIFEADDIKWLGEYEGKLYLSVLEISLPFAGYYIPSYSIVELDPDNGKRRIIAWDPVYLPFKFGDGKLYYARPEIAPGFNNKINLGYGNVGEIISVDLLSGEKKIIFKGPIKAFAVFDGELYYSFSDGCCGSVLYKMNLETRVKEKLLRTEELEIYDITVSKKEIFLGARKDGIGSDLYVLEEGVLKRLTQTPFTETNLSFTGKGLIFSANEDGIWEAYLWKDGKILRITKTGFCESPALYNDSVFCLGISDGKKVLYNTILRGEEIFWSRLEDINAQEVPNYSRPLRNYNLASLLFPDLYFVNFWRKEDIVEFGAIGHDSLDENFYQVTFSSSKTASDRFEFNFYSFSPSPVILDLSLKIYPQEKEMDMGFALPIFRSQRKALRSSYFYFSFADRVGEERRASLSGAGDFIFSNQTNRIKFYISPQIEIEDNWTGSHINRKGYFIDAGFLASPVRNSGIFLSISYGNDQDNPSGITYKTISWGEQVLREGALIYGEVSFRIANIRKGISNPHLFVDGIYSSVFAEALESEEFHRKAIGGFLSVEISSYHGLLKLYPMVGISYRLDDNKIVPVLGINGFFYTLEIFRSKSPFRKTFYSGFNKSVLRRLK